MRNIGKNDYANDFDQPGHGGMGALARPAEPGSANRLLSMTLLYCLHVAC
jgi:hypothetical protein